MCLEEAYLFEAKTVWCFESSQRWCFEPCQPHKENANLHYVQPMGLFAFTAQTWDSLVSGLKAAPERNAWNWN